jgi:hypothetical protein
VRNTKTIPLSEYFKLWLEEFDNSKEIVYDVSDTFVYKGRTFEVCLIDTTK